MVSIVACQTTGQGTATAPLPTGISYTVPGEDVKPARAQYAGKWYGAVGPRGNPVKVALVVQAISERTATVTFSMGGGTLAGRTFEPKYHEVKAQFIGKRLETKLPDGDRVVFSIQQDGRMQAKRLWVGQDGPKATWGFMDKYE